MQILHPQPPTQLLNAPCAWPDQAWADLLVFVAQVKGMIVGRNGAVIGQIGKLARLELNLIFQKTVHLFLQVKVAKKHGQ